MHRLAFSSSPAEDTAPHRLAPPVLGGTRRRVLAAGLVGVGALPLALLAGCGNQAQKQANDVRPDPRASTQGARVVPPGPAGVLSSSGPTAAPIEQPDTSSGSGVVRR